jgi:hypothetical protein
MPVTFSTTANGFTTGNTYFVLTNDSVNTITVNSYPGQAAIQATGSSAVNCIASGYANFEIAGLGPNDYLTGIDYNNIDAEGVSTCRVYTSNAYECSVSTGYISTTGASGSTFVCRGTYCSKIDARYQGGNYTLDGDLASNTTAVSMNRGSLAPTGGGMTGYGICNVTATGTRQLASTAALYLKGNHAGELYINSDSYDLDVGLGLTIDQSQIASAGSWLLNNRVGNYSFSTAAGGTLTLPTITTNSVGKIVFFCNPQANTCVLSTGASQTINGASGVTTFTAAANSTYIFIASYDTTIGLYWAVK